MKEIPYQELLTKLKKFEAEYADVRAYIKEHGADILRNFRASNYLSQSSAARHLDISVNYISKIENGQAPLSTDLLEKIINYKPPSD
jgi:ribosome-binding protein aMBF1 (putative translation factor)